MCVCVCHELAVIYVCVCHELAVIYVCVCHELAVIYMCVCVCHEIPQDVIVTI